MAVTAADIGPARSFDPRRVGDLEFRMWVAYYRREWGPFLRAAVPVVRRTFGLSWPATIYGAFLVLRANKRWARAPVSDPDGARADMRRFYRLVAARSGEPLDCVEAARLEVDWWRVHREHQHDASVSPRLDSDEPQPSEAVLVDALTRLYAHVYKVPADSVRPAAGQRAVAMRLSDAWVADGTRLDSPLLARERAALVRSYAALLSAVHR